MSRFQSIKKHRAVHGVFLSYENKLSYQNPSPKAANYLRQVPTVESIPDNHSKYTGGPSI